MRMFNFFWLFWLLSFMAVGGLETPYEDLRGWPLIRRRQGMFMAAVQATGLTLFLGLLLVCLQSPAARGA